MGRHHPTGRAQRPCSCLPASWLWAGHRAAHHLHLRSLILEPDWLLDCCRAQLTAADRCLPHLKVLWRARPQWQDCCHSWPRRSTQAVLARHLLMHVLPVAGMQAAADRHLPPPFSSAWRPKC